jgi:CubicO group peptidase (beta-lactamase class C family)
MRKYCFAFLFYPITLITHAQNPTYEKMLSQLDVIVPAQMKEWNVAGVAIGVVYKDKLVYAKGFGYRDLAKKLPVTPETFFRIGSNTKAFTAALIGVLEEKHKRNYLDAPVRELMPELQFKDELTSIRVTPRDLMSHRTGLPRGDWYGYGVFSESDSFFMRISNVPPQAAFRTQYIYNNYMFNALGKLSEKLTGRAWEQNLREYFFDPLDMKQTGTKTSDWLKNENRSMGYTVRNDSIVLAVRDSVNFGPFAAGSVMSNLPELSNWVSAWIHGGKYHGKQVIPESYYQQALSAHSNVVPSYDPANPEKQLNSYGLGFNLMSYRGHYLVYHGGRVGGFTTNVSFMPQDSLGVIVLINQNSSPLYYNLMYSVYDRLLKLPPVDWNKRERDARRTDSINSSKLVAKDSIDRISNTQTSVPLAEYAGVYFNPGVGYLKVTFENGSLMAQINTGAKSRLTHYHYNMFNGPAPDQPSGIRKYRFGLNESGVVDKVRFVDRVSKIEYMFNRQ